LRVVRGFAISAWCCALVACDCRPPIPRPDGGTDAGLDAGLDAGADAGSDAGVDAGADAGADAGVSFCDGLIAATCRWSQRCGQLDAPQLADCLALRRWTCHQGQLDALIDAGRLGFAGTQVPRCLSALEASSCALAYPSAPECALFSPATPAGGPCTRQWSTVCAGGYCQGTGCPATCASHLPLDAGCGVEGDACGPDAYCSLAAPRVCTAFLQPGAPCTANDRCAGGDCDSQRGVCVAYGSQPADAGCTFDLLCASGLYCKSGACSRRESVGGPCRVYGGLDCDEPFTCDVPDALIDGGVWGTCQARSGDGGVCYGLPADCLPGLLCDTPMLFTAGRCVPYRSQGQPCSRMLLNCKVGLYCDASTQTCLQLPHLGEPCVRDPGNFRGSDCADGFCPADAGTCRAPQPEGHSCAAPWECESTLCSNGTCEALCTQL
jgi:hypothetical protein